MQANNLGQTALHLATLNNDLFTINLLIDYTTPLEVDDEGNTALDLAKANNSSEAEAVLQSYALGLLIFPAWQTEFSALVRIELGNF